MYGNKFDDDQVVKLWDEGLNVPEDGFYVQKDFYDKNQETIKKFVHATKKGWEYAAKNKKEALDIVVNYMSSNNIEYKTKHQEWMLDVVLDKQINKLNGVRDFYLDPDRFDWTVKMLYENKMIRRHLTYEQFVKNL